MTPTPPKNFLRKFSKIPKNSPKLALVGSRDLLSFWWFCSNRNLSLVLIYNSPTFPQLLVPNFPRIRRISDRISAQIDEQPADLIAIGSSVRDRKFRPQRPKVPAGRIFDSYLRFSFWHYPFCVWTSVLSAISATTSFRNIDNDDGTPRIQAVHLTPPTTIASSRSSATIIKWYNLPLNL